MQRRGITYQGCILDSQQVEAVVACDDVQLVLASAGSGKTLSLLAKIDYLINELHLPPPSILVISFTNKTVAELKERCPFPDVEIRTFHSLGNDILKYNQQPNLPHLKLISTDDARRLIRRLILAKMKADIVFARRVHDFVLFDFSAPRSVGQQASHSMRVRFNQWYLRKTLAQNTNAINTKELELISNWLLIHQIPFRVRRPYPYQNDYRPDFTIGGRRSRKIFVDIIVLNASNKSFYGVDYLRTCIWRQRLHCKNHTHYVQLFTCDWDDNSVYSKLAKALKRFGFRPRRQEEAKIFALLMHSEVYRAELRKLSDFMTNYISQQKNNMLSYADVIRKYLQFPDVFSQRRARRYSQIYFPIYQAYANYLAEKRQYDFVDMINDAIQTVQQIPECASHYQYILLDEVQDLSQNRCELIRAILDKNPNCKLFAVGDDWQSIYRFTGSNLDLVYRFAQHFRRPVHQSLIEATHRFGQPTIRLSSGFIQKNPLQFHKHIHGDKQKHTPIYVVLSEQSNDDTAALLAILQQLRTDYGEKLSEKSIQIISRYNHDINRLHNYDDLQVHGAGQLFWQGIRLDYCSMHKSKGITRDIVIALNMNSSPNGMPATRETDPLIDVLLSNPESFAFAEERRLFYVAITRARERTYLIASSKHPSPFVLEVCDELNGLYQKLCPRCQIGELVHRTTKQGELEYCSNFRYGCDYIRWRK